MFDINHFKRSVKSWIQTNPEGEVADLVDYCEELIPSNKFAANQWLIDQTVGWFEHVKSQRERAKKFIDEDEAS